MPRLYPLRLPRKFLLLGAQVSWVPLDACFHLKINGENNTSRRFHRQALSLVSSQAVSDLTLQELMKLPARAVALPVEKVFVFYVLMWFAAFQKKPEL